MFNKTNDNDNYENALLETLVDFYVMSNSNLIISISVYGWGSSFSDMCSQIYNGPIIKMKL